MLQIPAIRWLAKCGLGAALSFLACGLATAWFGNGLPLPATTTRDGTLITLNRYVREPIPDVVLVGSSLTFRLHEEYFATPGLRNLALAGGSPVTGLEIVTTQPRLPRIILVEMNVLSRAIDTTLVERYSHNGVADPWFFRPIRTAVAAYENWNHVPLTHARVASALEQLVRQPPSDFDNRRYLDRAVQELNAEDPTVAAGTNVLTIGRLIQVAERQGARVLFFELPYPTPVDDTRSARVTHEIAHAAFPDPDRWLKLDYPTTQLRWSDGIHLDERSAAIVAQSFDKALSSLH